MTLALTLKHSPLSLLSGEQLSFSWTMPKSQGQNDFIALSPHQTVIKWLHNWRDWPASPRLRGVVVVGPEASGKTHLISLWANQIKAYQPNNLENLQNIPPTATVWLDAPFPLLYQSNTAQEHLFHLCNRLAEQDGRLLISDRTPPARWQHIVEDVRSRLSALPVVNILPPNDALAQNLLIKHFSDRQIRVSEDVIHYLIPRINRDYKAILSIVDKIDKYALQYQQTITLPLVRKAIN